MNGGNNCEGEQQTTTAKCAGVEWSLWRVTSSVTSHFICKRPTSSQKLLFQRTSGSTRVFSGERSYKISSGVLDLEYLDLKISTGVPSKSVSPNLIYSLVCSAVILPNVNSIVCLWVGYLRRWWTDSDGPWWTGWVWNKDHLMTFWFIYTFISTLSVGYKGLPVHLVQVCVFPSDVPFHQVSLSEWFSISLFVSFSTQNFSVFLHNWLSDRENIFNTGETPFVECCIEHYDVISHVGWQPCWKTEKLWSSVCISETAPRKKFKLGTEQVLLFGNEGDFLWCHKCLHYDVIIANVECYIWWV